MDGVYPLLVLETQRSNRLQQKTFAACKSELIQIKSKNSHHDFASMFNANQ